MSENRPISVDSGSCGEPFGYVKHRSKCTFAFSDIFAIFGECCTILSRFLSILTSFLVPKSPKISKNGVSELRSKIDTSKNGPRSARRSLIRLILGAGGPWEGGGDVNILCQKQQLQYWGSNTPMGRGPGEFLISWQFRLQFVLYWNSFYDDMYI